jgi:pteridine reductase
LITGAARRVAAGIASALHERGLNVVVDYRSSAREATDLAAKLNPLRADSAHTLSADLCDTGQVAALVKDSVAHFGALNVPVNNASSFYSTPLEHVSLAQFDDLMGRNLKGPLFLSAVAYSCPGRKIRNRPDSCRRWRSHTRSLRLISPCIANHFSMR